MVLGNEGDGARVEQQNVVDDGDGGAMDLGAGEELPTESFPLLEEVQSLVSEEFEVERIVGHMCDADRLWLDTKYIGNDLWYWICASSFVDGNGTLNGKFTEYIQLNGPTVDDLK